MIDINKIDMKQVSQLVLVDTRQASRIGKLAAVLDERAPPALLETYKNVL